MSRFLAHLVPLLMLSSAFAADIQDAPPPESVNWIGIVIFLVIFVGGSVVFIWMVYRNDKKTKQNQKDIQA